MKLTKPFLKALSDFWVENFVNGHHCSLCGNSGIIDTRGTAVTGAAIKSGRLNWCICPNGMAIRSNAGGKTPEDLGHKSVQDFIKWQEEVIVKHLESLDTAYHCDCGRPKYADAIVCDSCLGGNHVISGR